MQKDVPICHPDVTFKIECPEAWWIHSLQEWNNCIQHSGLGNLTLALHSDKTTRFRPGHENVKISRCRNGHLITLEALNRTIIDFYLRPAVYISDIRSNAKSSLETREKVHENKLLAKINCHTDRMVDQLGPPTPHLPSGHLLSAIKSEPYYYYAKSM